MDSAVSIVATQFAPTLNGLGQNATSSAVRTIAKDKGSASAVLASAGRVSSGTTAASRATAWQGAGTSAPTTVGRRTAAAALATARPCSPATTSASTPGPSTCTPERPSHGLFFSNSFSSAHQLGTSAETEKPATLLL